MKKEPYNLSKGSTKQLRNQTVQSEKLFFSYGVHYHVKAFINILLYRSFLASAKYMHKFTKLED